MDMIGRYSADAVRYWAASTSLGKDAVISERKIELGAKLANKLWNVARFSQRFLLDEDTPYIPPPADEIPPLSTADRWILSRTQRLIRQVTQRMRKYDYAAAKNEVESYFWTELADNYIEMAKLRLYDETDAAREGARYALYHVLLATIQLLAPFLPHVTEQIYLGLFAPDRENASIHRSQWPAADIRLEDDASERAGEMLVQTATTVRRYKSEHSLSLGSELEHIQLTVHETDLLKPLAEATADLKSITRAAHVSVTQDAPDPELEIVSQSETIAVALCP
jgi:valyl-tRNA synthetase